MPQVSPITITLDITPIEMKPAGGNGSGSMSYRSADQRQTLVVVPKPGDGKKIPDRADVRINMAFVVQDPLDVNSSVGREAFARVNFTLPPERDIQTDQLIDGLITALQAQQVRDVLKGETFW